MTRLVAAELRKVWRSRFFLVALAALLGANLFLLWVGTKPASSAFTPAAYHALCADIAGMDMPQMGEFLHESLRRAEAMSRIENVLRTEAWNGGTQDEYMRAQYAQEFSEFYEEYAAGNYLRYGDTLPREYTFLKTIVLEYDEVAGYDAFLDSIAQKAQQLSSISIFANSADGYDLANIEATARAFEGMRGIPIQYYPQRGLMTALDFALTDVVAVFAMLAIVIVTEVLIIMRFYRLLGDDGYFWFSLPVTPAQHMIVKLIAAMVWSFASVALFVGGIFAFVLVANNMENGAVLAELWAALRFTTTLGPVFGVLGLFVLASLLTMAAGCLQVQLACALGMQWPQSRLGASIGMYVLLSVATQILWTAATVGGGVFLVASGPHMTTLPATEVPRVLMTAMGGFCLLCFILCAVYFAVTRWLLTKRLNLA